VRCRVIEEHELERPVVELDPEIAGMIRRDPSTVVGVLAPLLSEERMARIESVLASRVRSVVLVLDQLADPHNRAAVLRTAEGLGVQEVRAVQPDGVWPLSRRVTQGCHKWLDVFVDREASGCADGLERRGYVLVEATEKAGDTFRPVAADAPVAVCFGNEHAGVTEALRARCTACVGVPMVGFTRSFNVSVAAALLLRELLDGRARGLPPAEVPALRARYYALSVRNALAVLRREVGKA
jgi:tRNA (guanosine-2'-O-)-methyltransferase